MDPSFHQNDPNTKQRETDMDRPPQHGISEEFIRHSVERMLPEPAARFRLLSVFAQSIERVHSHGASKWGVYFTDRGTKRIRLLSGMLIVITVSRAGLWLSLDKQTMTSSHTLRSQLDKARDWHTDTGERPDGYPEYSLVPSTNVYYSPGPDHEQNWPPLRALHFAFLDRVARKYPDLKTSSQHRHQPALLSFLRTCLCRDLPDPRYPSESKAASVADPMTHIADRIADLGEFDAENVEDARQRILASIVRRRGQPAFRKLLLEVYGGSCAFSACTLVDVLDAAHIVPYQGGETNHPQNGLLLRTDIHALFDLGLLAVDTGDMTIVVAPVLRETEYAQLAGKKVRTPGDPAYSPSIRALDAHRASSRVSCGSRSSPTRHRRRKGQEP